MAVSMLQEIGFEVVAVDNGREAVEAFASEPSRFALVLLDLTMPVMNGADALRAIRSLAPDARILMMSGFDEQESSERFGTVPPPTFIHKPFSLNSLRDSLRHLVD
jgi:CheY-like chemotaxis protein